MTTNTSPVASGETRAAVNNNGSMYVAGVILLLIGYFTYQWWFNPNRIIKRQLGEIAEILSVPAGTQGPLERASRAVKLSGYLADDAKIEMGQPGPNLVSRDAMLAALRAWTPPPEGMNVAFVDTQIAVDSDTTAHAYMTVETTVPDPRTGQPSFDTRDVRVSLEERDGSWLVTRVGPAIQ